MTGARSVWVVRREFGPHPAVDLHGVLPRWWTGEFNEHGEPEDAALFGRRIDAEAAYRVMHGRVDRRTRAQRLEEALAEVGAEALPKSRTIEHYENLAAEAAAEVPARLGRTDEAGHPQVPNEPALVSKVGSGAR